MSNSAHSKGLEIPDKEKIQGRVDVFNIADESLLRELNSVAGINSAPKAFSGSRRRLTIAGTGTSSYVIGGAVNYTGIGAPIEVGGPSGSNALTISPKQARQQRIHCTSEYGWPDWITDIVRSFTEDDLLQPARSPHKTPASDRRRSDYAHTGRNLDDLIATEADAESSAHAVTPGTRTGKSSLRLNQILREREHSRRGVHT
jgi:hypothetical protein